jgi:hypothetical protein
MSSIAFAAAEKASGAAKAPNAPTPINTPAANASAPNASAPAAPTNTVVTKIRADVPLPPKKSGGRGGQTIYDFDKLEIGQSFGVVGKTIKGMASTVSSANKRFTEEVKDAEGNVVMIDDPKKPGTKKAVTKQTRKFICGTVTPTEDDPATVRVWRVPLDY